MDLSYLNQKQLEAVQHTEGPELIIAGAGSGKTRTLVYRIAYLISEKNVNPLNIIAVTFTNKAANEMQRRVKKMIGDKADKLWVSTFHSMCVAILRNTAGVVGYTGDFTICDEDDRKKRLKELCSSFEGDVDPSEFGDNLSYFKNNAMTPEDIKPTYGDGIIYKLYVEYQDRLKKDNVMDFDDLLLNTYLVLRDNDYIRETYQSKCKYLMVDEYQDTNHVQFELVRLLSGQYKNLCVVGDDDQSIYKFRGADVKNILDFQKEYPDAYVVRLEENYRSTGNIVAAASALVQHNASRLDKDLYTSNEDGTPVKVLYASDERVEAWTIAYRIKNLISNGVPGSDIAVLYRMSMLSRNIEEALMRYNVPYTIVGGVSFYGRKEIKDIIAYLKTIYDGQDSMSVKRIINVPKRGIGSATVASFARVAEEKDCSLYEALKQADPKGKSYNKIMSFVNKIEELREYLKTHSVTELINKLLIDLSYEDYLRGNTADNPDVIRDRVENIQELVSNAAIFESNLPNTYRGRDRLREFLDNIALYTEADRRKKRRDGVTLMTIHSSKGLEFPYVYIIGLDEGIFPRSIHDDLEEETRLMYVGMTRAMKQLCISHANKRTIYGYQHYMKPSCFLYQLPERRIQRQVAD